MKLSDIDPNDIEVIEEAPKAQGLRLSDLDDSDIEVVESQGPGIGESLGRGSIQGASFGMGDELAGLQKAITGQDLDLGTYLPPVAMGRAAKNIGGKLYDVATTDKTLSDLLKELKGTYVSKRDEVRADNKLAEETNPVAYNVGDIGTSVATGLMTGGAGLVGKGLSAAGLKLAAKEGGKELLEQGIKRGGLGALTTIGTAEGLLHGAGRSEADLTEGEVGEFATDTAIGGAIGAAAPSVLKGVGKVVKGTANLADDLTTKIPVVGDVYTHLKDVGREGVENMGLSFKQAANKALGKISQSADDIKAQGLVQEEKYAQDLAEAQVATNKGLYDSTDNWKSTLQKGKELVGTEIDNQDTLIDQALRKYGSLNDNISIRPDGTTRVSKFDFKDLAPEVEEVSKIIGKGNALNSTFNQMQDGSYSNVSYQMKQLNRIMEASDADEKHLLKGIKDKIQQRINQTMADLPEGEAKNLYKKRMDLNKDYSLLASLQEDMGAGFRDPTGKLQTKMSLAANPQSGGGDSLEFMNQLRKGYQSGNQDLIQSTDDALAKAKQYNKFNIENPVLGEMGLGQNEKQFQQFSEVFGKPKDFGVSSSFAKTVEELNDSARGIGQSSKRDNLVSWIKSTYGEKADDVIAGLQKDSKSFQTLKEGLDKNVRAGQDVSSIIRAVKKMADPIAYGAAQFGSTVSKKIPTMNQANSLRTLTQPQLYKDVVKGFKESQQQGDVDPNDVE